MLVFIGMLQVSRGVLRALRAMFMVSQYPRWYAHGNPNFSEGYSKYLEIQAGLSHLIPLRWTDKNSHLAVTRFCRFWAQNTTSFPTYSPSLVPV